MADPPTLSTLAEIADRALEHAQGEAQATVLWTRGRGGDDLALDVTCVLDGRAALARATGTDDGALRRAARAAATHARRARAWPSAGLPEAVEGRAHDGFDLAALQPGRPVAADAPGIEVELRTGASRIAIASTKGMRSAEQRSHAVAEVRAETAGRTIRLRAAAPGPSGLDLDGLLAQARALLREDAAPVELPAGEPAVVLGPDAVATLLDHLRPAFGVELDLGSGPLHGRAGTRVASAAVNLSDSPRYTATLPRSFDAEGLPRRPVPLIQDGVAHRRVHDTASAARAGAGATSTGHATRAGALAPIAEHLVLVGGGAAGIEELCAPIARGLYVPALSPAREARGEAFLHTTMGAVVVEAGSLAAPVRDGELRIDPLAVLASVEALTSRSRTLPLNGHAPGGLGAAVVPALRAGGGCFVVPR